MAFIGRDLNGNSYVIEPPRQAPPKEEPAKQETAQQQPKKK